MLELAAVIFVRDDRQGIARSIRSVSFASEVLVVDPEGSEGVDRVPRTLEAPTVRRVSVGAAFTKRWLAGETNREWVLWLEAGDEVTPALAREIRALFSSGAPRRAGYEVPVVMAFMGRPFSGASFRRLQMRLFDRRRGDFAGAASSPETMTSGDTGRLAGAVHHHAFRDLSDAVAEMNSDSATAAAALAMAGRRPGVLASMLAALREFFRQYLLNRAIRDGLPGFAWSFLRAISAALARLKAHELVAEEEALGRGPLDEERSREGRTGRAWRS